MEKLFKDLSAKEYQFTKGIGGNISATFSGARKINWKAYFIEAWALGMFMVSASFFVVLFEHPDFYMVTIIPNVTVRRIFIAAAMGITAIVLIYSGWGKQSGAHMNPAVTLANYFLNRISLKDAAGYIVAQLFGALLAMLLLKTFFHPLLVAPSVNYIVTLPDANNILMAFIAEFILSFTLFIVVLVTSNSKFAQYTGWFAGMLVFIFIAVEAPLSGMSINPARSFGPAFVTGNWNHYWIYFFAPILGMQLAAYVFRTYYYFAKGECKSMHCFMSGRKHNNSTYHVFKWSQRNETGKTLTIYASKHKP